MQIIYVQFWPYHLNVSAKISFKFFYYQQSGLLLLQPNGFCVYHVHSEMVLRKFWLQGVVTWASDAFLSHNSNYYILSPLFSDFNKVIINTVVLATYFSIKHYSV